MIHRALVLISVCCCGIVLASFTLFARDQMGSASAHQQAEVNMTTTTQAASHPPHQPRRFIEGADHTLTAPFRSIVQSHNAWVDEGVPTLLALAVYGLGLGYLARYSRGFS